MSLVRPLFLKVEENFGLNLNLIATWRVERDAKYQKRTLKDPSKKGSQNRDDYDFENKQADVLYIYYADERNSGLALRVGETISQENFDRVVNELKTLLYWGQKKGEEHDRGTVPVEAA